MSKKLEPHSGSKRERIPEEEERESKRTNKMNFTMEELLMRMGALMDEKIDPIKERIKNLATKEDILRIQQENNELREENELRKAEIEKLNKEIKARNNEICQLQNEIRRNNIILGGLATTEGRNVKEQVTEFFQSSLGFETGSLTIVSARILRGRGDAIKPILVTLLGQDDKDAIFQRAPALKNTGFWISSDYTYEIREKRRHLQSIRKILMKSTQGQNIRVSFDKLWVGKEVFNWDQEKRLLHRQGCGFAKIREMLGVNVEEKLRELEAGSAENFEGAGRMEALTS
ncbi:hypothetical protein GE061_015221 [Apolygus lucorum]|uniref:Uncharacterized protein n=1 Tax=Apolygus lucorum TaxID=248454 RepID=A0A8S9XLK0_APOLU|nr:hypothetical protein GE061_015221 [Apolygus lucorum]